MSEMLDAALGYVERGYRIFPCHHPVGGRCSCGHRDCTRVGKHPRINEWQTVATSGARTIEAWWRDWPNANIGLPTGAANGVTVLDEDPRHGGNATMVALEARHGQLPLTVIMRTGSGGYHYFFRHVIPDVGNSANRVGPGLDVRADNGYVLVPPSLHASGTRYEPFSGGEFADAPAWLIKLMREGNSAGRSSGGSGNRKPASHWRRLLDEIHDGEGREDALTSPAGALWHDGVAADRLLPLLEQFNERHCRPPKPASHLRRIAKSIRRYAR
jgi:hypothetical protein